MERVRLHTELWRAVVQHGGRKLTLLLMVPSVLSDLVGPKNLLLEDAESTWRMAALGVMWLEEQLMLHCAT